jgi:hypothetical protein
MKSFYEGGGYDFEMREEIRAQEQERRQPQPVMEVVTEDDLIELRKWKNETKNK